MREVSAKLTERECRRYLTYNGLQIGLKMELFVLRKRQIIRKYKEEIYENSSGDK